MRLSVLYFPLLFSKNLVKSANVFLKVEYVVRTVIPRRSELMTKIKAARERYFIKELNV